MDDSAYEDYCNPAKQGQTFGQRLVGIRFNPSNNDSVHAAKQVFATMIDQMSDLRDLANSQNKFDQYRYCSIAITELQTAQMWIVKAITAET
jgi:hypothetical protein